MGPESWQLFIQCGGTCLSGGSKMVGVLSLQLGASWSVVCRQCHMELGGGKELSGDEGKMVAAIRLTQGYR